MHFVFWQNILSPHQSPFIRALAEQGHAVTVVTVETMNAERLALGWKVPDQGRAKIIIAPQAKEIQHQIECSTSDTIHVMAGARWTPLGNVAVRQCRVTKRRVGILTESPDPRGLAGTARWIKYSAERFGHELHYDFILAMGEMGVNWFRRCGYPAKKEFPFAYVTEPGLLLSSTNASNKVSLLYVGQFIARKCLDLLLRAIALIPSDSVELRLLGAGPEQQQLQVLARVLGIQDRIIWLGKADAKGVQTEMTRADVLLLPSGHDGWGAVVNESLMAGTPVVCSDACGAAELIRYPWLGSVFRSGNTDELKEQLKQWIGRGARQPGERERIRNWARCINGDSVARYFIAVMEHVYGGAVRPVPPWRVASADESLFSPGQ